MPAVYIKVPSAMNKVLYGTLSDPRTLSDPGTLSDPKTVQNCSLSDPGKYRPISAK